MKLSCQNARTLIPSYLDGEVSEEQAGPLRKHLLACPACREVAKADTALKRWFVDEPPVEVPAGFAARVARRAFAGDPGELTPVPAATGSHDMGPFLLRLNAVAALLLIAFAIGLRVQDRPSDRGVDALSERDLPAIFEELDRLNGPPGALRPPAAQPAAQPAALKSSGEASDEGERPTED